MPPYPPPGLVDTNSWCLTLTLRWVLHAINFLQGGSIQLTFVTASTGEDQFFLERKGCQKISAADMGFRCGVSTFSADSFPNSAHCHLASKQCECFSISDSVAVFGECTWLGWFRLYIWLAATYTLYIYMALYFHKI